MVQMQIEGDFLASSFSVLEEQPMDMLLGLDMLKRHQVTSFPFKNTKEPSSNVNLSVQHRFTKKHSAYWDYRN